MSAGSESLSVIDGRYRVIAELGRGAFAKAYRCEDREGGGEVVVKLYELGQRAWSLVTSFEREAAVLSELSHPAIPRYLAHRQLPDGRLMLVQSYARGTSLAELLRQKKRFSDDEVADLAEQVLAVLTYLHRLNPPIVHRDIKPSNLVISDEKRVQLVDFGSVKATFSRDEELGSTIVGTYGYMAPEQFQGRAGVQSDLYGLGATLVHVLSHIPPSDLPQDGLRLDFEGSVKADAGLIRWLGRMLEPDPRHRFADASQALEAFRKRDESAVASQQTDESTQTLLDVKVEPPVGSRIKAERVEDELRIDMPRKGLSGISLPLAGFAMVWLIIVGLWTATVLLESPLFAAFSIPFWLVGLVLMRSALRGMFAQTRILIGPQRYSVDQRGLGDRRLYEGPTSQLEGASVRPSGVVVNGWELEQCVLHTAAQDIDLGGHLSRGEQRWLVATINQMLGREPDEP